MLPVPLWWLCFFCCCNYCCPSLPWVGVVVRAFPYRVQMQLINRAISSLKSSFLLNSRSKFYKNKNCLNLRQQILHQWLITSRVVIANIHVLYNRYRSRICNASTYFYVSPSFLCKHLLTIPTRERWSRYWAAGDRASFEPYSLKIKWLENMPLWWMKRSRNYTFYAIKITRVLLSYFLVPTQMIDVLSEIWKSI